MRLDLGPVSAARGRRLRLVAVLVVAAVLAMVVGPARRDPAMTLAGALLAAGALAWAARRCAREQDRAQATRAASHTRKTPNQHFPISPEAR
ncbi:hypothetical protein [Caulobacter hibisci]|uniref:Uncharacterized protein n=1 Tax=Caulobacter hibisci TaxID=2035993 RepID=A0ABS0SXE3_9CAUL|nr:hypothetical protein [Caulobacter hibisci]MBI1684204.1 hypothetical protein [Caulobacter hibisci]